MGFDGKPARDDGSQAGGGDDPQTTAGRSPILEKNAQENLEKLYEEGFHICHFFYGWERNGDCLFCRGLLGK